MPCFNRSSRLKGGLAGVSRAGSGCAGGVPKRELNMELRVFSSIVAIRGMKASRNAVQREKQREHGQTTATEACRHGNGTVISRRAAGYSPMILTNARLRRR